MSLRDELVQVAAVACAIVQDLDTGHTAPVDAEHTGRVLDDVISERDRQQALHGDQHHDLAEWMMILMEEVGEVARAWRDEVRWPGLRPAAGGERTSEVGYRGPLAGAPYGRELGGNPKSYPIPFDQDDAEPDLLPEG